MIVEFKSVRADFKEAFDTDRLEELNGMASIPFENEEDYIANINIEMDTVIDFAEGRVYYNGVSYECIYVNTSEDNNIPNILISYTDFKFIFEKATNNKVYTLEEVKSIT